MTTYAELAGKIVAVEDHEVGTGVSEDEIVAAEQILGVVLAGAYRQFLKQFRWASLGNLEVYGLGPGGPEYLDLVKVTISERSEMEPKLPRHLVPLMNDGGGNLYCLDTKKGQEPAVVFWDHELGERQKPSRLAKDFATWLAQEIDELDDDDDD